MREDLSNARGKSNTKMHMIQHIDMLQQCVLNLTNKMQISVTNIAKLESHEFKLLNNIMKYQNIDLNMMKIYFHDNKLYKCIKIVFMKCVQVL